jgi:hypothetical protein
MTFIMGLTLGFVVGMIVMSLFIRIVRWHRALRYGLHQVLPRLKELGYLATGVIGVVVIGLLYWRVL